MKTEENGLKYFSYKLLMQFINCERRILSQEVRTVLPDGRSLLDLMGTVNKFFYTSRPKTQAALCLRRGRFSLVLGSLTTTASSFFFSFFFVRFPHECACVVKGCAYFEAASIHLPFPSNSLPSERQRRDAPTPVYRARKLNWANYL